MNHTAHDMVRWDGLGNTAFGIDGVERRTLQLATKALEKPPRHTVHSRQHRRIGP